MREQISSRISELFFGNVLITNINDNSCNLVRKLLFFIFVFNLFKIFSPLKSKYEIIFGLKISVGEVFSSFKQRLLGRDVVITEYTGYLYAY